MSKEQSTSIENEQVNAILAREWAIIVESDFAQLIEHYPVGPDATAVWINQLVRKDGVGNMNDIKRAVDLLAPTLWRRRHQLIVQTLDALNVEQLQAIVSPDSLEAYFGKELTSKEKYEAFQWAEGKLSMLPKEKIGQIQIKQVTSEQSLARILFDTVQSSVDGTD